MGGFDGERLYELGRDPMLDSGRTSASMNSIRLLQAPLAASRREPRGRRPAKRAVMIATCSGAATLSLAMSVACLWQVKAELDLRRLSHESRDWPSATGDIVAAELDRSGGRGPSVGASVRYRYVIGTKTFEGRTLSFDRPRNGAAESAVRRYRPGTTVSVFYSPRDRGLSVLEADSWSGWSRVGALTVVTLGAALFALLMLRLLMLRLAHG
jgi:Protein of unknown function (DUF3592)